MQWQDILFSLEIREESQAHSKMTSILLSHCCFIFHILSSNFHFFHFHLNEQMELSICYKRTKQRQVVIAFTMVDVFSLNMFTYMHMCAHSHACAAPLNSSIYCIIEASLSTLQPPPRSALLSSGVWKQ